MSPPGKQIYLRPFICKGYTSPIYNWIRGYNSLFTLPETNIDPENEPLEEEIPIKNHHF